MNNNEHYISAARITKQFDITSNTLRTWANAGKIRCLRPCPISSKRGGKRIYNVEDVKRVFGIEEKVKGLSSVCYARVSSNHQKQDLERQIELLKEHYPNNKIIKDIGSGLNWKRSGFNSLLEEIYAGNVGEVVVTYKDRLCRFGFELVEWIFKKHDVKLVGLGSVASEQNAINELSEDLLAIVTVFVARNNGQRAGRYKRERNEKGRSKEIEKREETIELPEETLD